MLIVCMSGFYLLSQTIMLILIENPWKRETECALADWTYPKTDAEKLKYAVFRDLWEKNYYLTSGQKFGGDFLAYPGK